MSVAREEKLKARRAFVTRFAKNEDFCLLVVQTYLTFLAKNKERRKVGVRFESHLSSRGMFLGFR